MECNFCQYYGNLLNFPNVSGITLINQDLSEHIKIEVTNNIKVIGKMERLPN